MSETVGSLLALAKSVGLPIVEGRLLLTHVCGLNRTQQSAHPERALDDPVADRFRALVARRQLGEPIAYLIGVREFFSLDFTVTPAVLIPRPETELLVELALARLPAEQPASALDLGTGSGAIAVAVKTHRPLLAMTAVDVSADALAVAQGNAMRHAAEVRFVQSDWYAALGEARFDVIVSNPPYIAHDDAHLALGDLRFEPSGALTDQADGLRHIRQIVAQAPSHLLAGGWLLFEHGYDQAAASRDLLAAAGFTDVASWCDLAGIERVTGGRWVGA